MRPFTAGDSDLLTRHHGDPAVMALMKGGVQSPAQARAELDGYLATWRDHGFGMWALYHKDDDAFVGECGLRLSDDGLPTRLRVALAASWQGQGLAREAGAAAVQFGFESARLDRLVGVTKSHNAPSRKTLEAIGLVYRPDLDRRGGEAVVYELTREAWFSRRAL
jgi:ribosomal-protein-alanine N-acetyltransferase